jgi:hypothetical protein
MAEVKSLNDYATTTVLEPNSSIIRPAVNANNFKLKPSFHDPKNLVIFRVQFVFLNFS